jgi:hypothetical protein
VSEEEKATLSKVPFWISLTVAEKEVVSPESVIAEAGAKLRVQLQGVGVGVGTGVGVEVGGGVPAIQQ